mmetsp:Transcript_18089/g.57426  ORF Transcript_18089/g.57426 Transcript_18089/m.57426 type:complete len:247 (+) Transcript_18089:624-1364(+)
MPTPRYGHEAVCALGRYLVCIGGKAAGARESLQGSDEVIGGSADVLDVATGRWAPLPCRLENPRVYFGAAAVGRNIVVCGGMALGTPGRRALEGRLSSTEILDAADLPMIFEGAAGEGAPPSLRWRQGPSLQSPRLDFSLAGPINGRLYAVGGSGARRAVEALDVSELLAARVDTSAQWEVHPVELPEARSCGNAVALGQRLLLVGGSQRAVLCFGPGDDSWAPLGAELDTMRLGAKAVAFGCGAC